MDVWEKIAIWILLISLLTFIALFGRLPALRKTSVGALNRLLLVRLPALLYALDQRLTGGCFSTAMARVGHYLMNENHPLILGFFVILVSVSQLLFLPAALPFLSNLQRALALFFSLVPYVFIYASVASKSSIITLNNHALRMRQYPYDHVIFQPGNMCTTCRFLKPARSKHCSLCKACVSKHDHHCIWVMNCLGEGNYGYFVAMLFTVSTMLTYGAWLAYGILTHFMQGSRWDQREKQHANKYWSTGTTWSQYFGMWSWAIAQDFRIGAVGLLALLTAPLGWGLFLYHVYLIWAGMTTNESAKWEDWKEAVHDGLVFRTTENTAIINNNQGRDLEIEPVVQWPAFSNQQVMRCEDGRPPDGLGIVDVDLAEVATAAPPGHRSRWRKVHSMREVENLYDLGFWDNLWDIMPQGLGRT